jgi:hypothetical protein
MYSTNDFVYSEALGVKYNQGTMPLKISGEFKGITAFVVVVWVWISTFLSN